MGEQAAADQTVVEPAGTVAGSVETQQLTQQLGNLSHHDEQFSMPTMPAYRSAAVGEHKFECEHCQLVLNAGQSAVLLLC